MARGTFLAVEGTDRSDKDTQVTKLVERLEREGYQVATFDFPQYEKPSSYFIDEYQKGAYGSSAEVGPYTGSLFYALDRYQAAADIRDAINAGKVVIANRFTGSNMAHQGAKFDRSEHRRGYFIWLDNLEYEMLKIPRPDRSIVLRVPDEAAQSLVEVYDDLCQLFPKDFIRIDCTRDKKLLDTDTIHALLWQTIEPLLPPKSEVQNVAVVAKPSTSIPTRSNKLEWGSLVITTDGSGYETNKYYIPTNLDPQTREAYIKGIDRIYDLYAEMINKTTQYLQTNTSTPKDEQDGTWQDAIHVHARDAIHLVLPVAATLQKNTYTPGNDGTTMTPATSNKQPMQKLADLYLPDNHASETEPVTLTTVWPRNELNLVADMLYEYSNLPLKELEEEVATWPITRRMDIFESYINERLTNPKLPKAALEKARYNWDLVCSYSTFCELQGYHTSNDPSWQILTPRYGYEIPQLVEDAGLTDSFEQCFDLSLQLYSTLQAAGYENEAQYVTLMGHKIRWQVTYNAWETFSLLKLQTNHVDHSNFFKLLQAMYERIAEVHPMIAEAINSVR